MARKRSYWAQWGRKGIMVSNFHSLSAYGDCAATCSWNHLGGPCFWGNKEAPEPPKWLKEWFPDSLVVWPLATCTECAWQSLHLAGRYPEVSKAESTPILPTVCLCWLDLLWGESIKSYLKCFLESVFSLGTWCPFLSVPEWCCHISCVTPLVFANVLNLLILFIHPHLEHMGEPLRGTESLLWEKVNL